MYGHNKKLERCKFSLVGISIDNIGHRVLIEDIDFSVINSEDFYNSLEISKDFFGNITTIQSNDKTYMEFCHKSYVSISINRKENLLEFGFDYTSLGVLFAFSVVICISVFRKS